MSDGTTMETLSDAVARLQRDGYEGNWYASDDGELVCEVCHLHFDPSQVSVDHIVRFEGQSDPADSSILYALSTADGHRGLYTTTYGPETPTGDVALIRAIGRGAS